jgi:hypothetical protein
MCIIFGILAEVDRLLKESFIFSFQFPSQMYSAISHKNNKHNK